jgi:BMFP domain-containing protein YqiC
MHTQNPLMDEIAKLTQAAMGMAQAASEEAKTAFRAQGDKIVAEFDLVRRDELDAIKAELAALRAEVSALKGEAPKAAKPKAAPKAAAKNPSGAKARGKRAS